ncbi:MAG TPA: tripartite tricarboxylate transporter substrate binding protein [Quisquiliibacterium sp.]|nr:MAG: tripartite tricarboxylate transporter substrate binding protein [Burkholderiaceae bacterium]HOA92568.1 tripartite tricarboxylate transporter substrate binding protein [Quisquiliibacterium sp.]HPA90918.1 tripartite tricarboxylate transporter substrate binding protein [Quisquiliibacterium sp.]HQD81695.1 tripartite tricarboxylate transporter substrate binding protein [Quisquiliibacterium sp.]HQN13270.1 tripartite tricarboxylate transporter substrate binding protein [Quisquiliibacterium sp.
MLRLLSIAFAATMALAASPAAAQSYPSKPIRILVGFSPGGGTDVMARLIGQKLTEAWNAQVVVENRPGAGGVLAADLTAKAAPDGYTLMIGHVNSHGIAPAAMSKMPYDAARDFAPIILIGTTPNLLVANAGTGAKTLDDIVRAARANPGKLTFGSAGNGSSQHLATEMFKLAAKVDVLHIPYKGSGQMIPDLIAGQIGYSFDTMTAITPHVKSGKVTPIATTRLKRSPAYPNLPTVAELGYPGFDVSTWYGLMAPAGTPAEIVTRLNREVERILTLPDVKEKLNSVGAEDGGGSPEQFGKFVRDEIAKYAKIVKEAGVKLD